MIRFILVLLVLWHATTRACDTADNKRTIAQQLLEEREFSIFVCGDDPCNEAVLVSKTEIRKEMVNPTSDIYMCVAEPTRKARNMFIGVFLKSKRKSPKLELIFFGSYIKATQEMVRGYRTLEGREYIEADDFNYYAYEWSGSMYIDRGTNPLPPK